MPGTATGSAGSASPAQAPAVTSQKRAGTRWWETAIVAVSSLVLFLAAFLVWAQVSLFDSSGFVDRSEAALESEPVKERLAELVTQEIVTQRPRLAPASGLVNTISEGVISSSQFRDILLGATERLHSRIFDQNADLLVLEIPQVMARIRASLEVIAPELAAELPEGTEATQISIAAEDARADLLQIAESVRLLAFVLPLIAIAGFAAAIWLNADRWRGLRNVCIALVVVGALLLLTDLIAKQAVLLGVKREENEPAVSAIWDAFLSPFTTGAWVLAIVGVLVIAGVWWRSLQAASA
jgi:hypothetical protein